MLMHKQVLLLTDKGIHSIHYDTGMLMHTQQVLLLTKLHIAYRYADAQTGTAAHRQSYT